MPTFIIETTAESPIREFWKVEADSSEAAHAAFDEGEVGEFLWDEVTGDETEREVKEVHRFADMAGTVAIDVAQKAAPAMLAALQGAIEWVEFTGIADSDPQEYLAMVAAIEAATGGAPVEVRIPYVPAGDEEGPAGIVCDAIVLLDCVERAECFDGAEAGYFVLADGREFQFAVTPIAVKGATS